LFAFKTAVCAVAIGKIIASASYWSKRCDICPIKKKVSVSRNVYE
jgi:hypothetical protein